MSNFKQIWLSKYKLAPHAKPNTRHVSQLLLRTVGSILVIFAVTCAAEQSLADSTTVTQMRADYVKAEKALSAKRVDQWRKIKPRLINYPLYPYLLLHEIRADQSKFSNAAISKVVRELDIPIPSSFRNWWLNRLIANKNWKLVVEHYANSSSATTRCRYAEALIRRKLVKEATPVIIDLWLVPKSQAKQCDYVFDYATRNSIIDDQLIWERIVLAKDRNQQRLVKYLTELIKSNSVKRWVARLNNAHNHPRDTTRANFSRWSKSEHGAAVIYHAITKIARKDIEEAATIWSELKSSHPKAAARLVENEVNIARRLAIALHRDAYRWLANLPKSHTTLEFLKMRMRAAIANESWKNVLVTLELMPQEESKKSKWNFWKAYANYELGHQQEAEALWMQIAGEFSFYGLLAADQLKSEYLFQTQHETNISSDSQSAVMETPEILRIREWLALNRPYSARKELFRLSSVDDADFWFLAGVMFDKWQWHDGAVRAMRRSGNNVLARLDISFPVPFISHVRKESVRYEVPTHWIYGIIRQESNFVHNIRSSAGAIGLMQLLPSTARTTARKLKLNKVTTHDLTKASLNIRLGTAYFRGILDRMNHNPVYALAGYNAGPRRSFRWQNRSRSSDMLIWVETIPFSETRRYVKNILLNFIVYEHLLDAHRSRVSEYLPAITAKQASVNQ